MTNREQAMKELKELRARADALEAIINAPELPSNFGGIFLNTKYHPSFYLQLSGIPEKAGSISDADAKYGLAYVSYEAADKARVQLELHQKARKAVAESWGSYAKPDWDNNTQPKYSIQGDLNKKLTVSVVYLTYSKFAFKTREAAEGFIKTLTEDQQRLFIMGTES